MADETLSGRTLGERVRDVRLIERALGRAVREALLRHKQAGNPVAASRDGQVVWVEPDDIQIAND